MEDEIRLLFCMGEGAAWASERKIMRIDRNEACLILDHGEEQSMCYTSGIQYEFWSVALQREFDMQHEQWLFGEEQYTLPVLSVIDEFMGMPV